MSRGGRAGVGTRPVDFEKSRPATSVVDGIPNYLRDPASAAHDELDHADAHRHKAGQIAHFDRLAEEAFEASRPHGTARLYGFHLHEKFRRATAPIATRLQGSSVLIVCGGSGMDAEYFVRAGARVVNSDVSLGAATRARARAARYDLSMKSIVADVEDLPYSDQSVDAVAVHDGLHHLVDPYVGLEEMARVARRWVIVTEPARASVTRVAVRMGLALEAEHAGNRVARLMPGEVATFLEARGFRVLREERYAMYYPHRPGRVFKVLSIPFIYEAVIVGWRIANGILGRFGNKMIVLAERVEAGNAERADRAARQSGNGR